jgi:hypothetical protein
MVCFIAGHSKDVNHLWYYLGLAPPSPLRTISGFISSFRIVLRSIEVVIGLTEKGQTLFFSVFE